MNNETENIVNNLNEEFMDNIIHPKMALYYDIRCFVDFKMTALLTLVSEEDYKHIVNLLGVYNDRVKDTITEYFPLIKVTEEDVENLLKRIGSGTASRQEQVKFAIMTQYTSYFHNSMMMLRSYQMRKKLNKIKEPIMVMIGGEGMPVQKHLSTHILSIIREILPDGDVVFVPGKLTEQDTEVILSFDHITTYDFEHLITNNKFGKLMAEKELHGISFHVREQLTQNKSGLTNKQLLENLEHLMQHAYDFNYIKVRVGSHG